MRYRFSDLKRTTGGAGHAPYTAGMLGYDNYYPFGMMPEDRRATALTGGIGRYGYNGKEMDNEFNDRNGAGDGTANSYDYGARTYDPRIARFLSTDRFADRFCYISPYLFASNTPMEATDANGDSLYILTYVHGYEDGDEMCEAAARTRAYDIENGSTFDRNRDKVVVVPIRSVSEIKTVVESTVIKSSQRFGPTAEFGIYSHAGSDGPVGSLPAWINIVDMFQMSTRGWAQINFNWAKEGARAGFYGCRTGIDPPGPAEPFVMRLSKLSNFHDVTLLGRQSFSFPSQYTNVRDLAGYQFFGAPLSVVEMGRTTGLAQRVFGAPPIVATIHKTYMVGGEPGTGLRAIISSAEAVPMLVVKNGQKTQVPNQYQPGDVSDD